MTLEDKIAREVSRQIAPLTEVLNQIWAKMQASGAEGGELPPIPDPAIPDPPIPDPAIPRTPIPDTPIDIPPIPGFGPGARLSEAEVRATDEAAIRQRLQQAANTRQQEQSAVIARRTAMIQARIAKKLNAFQR